MKYTEFTSDLHALSVKDLLEARDAYHVFLTRKQNVVGTAIGYYRIRRNDTPKKAPKTLENTEIRLGYSWPAVLVFVKDWITEQEFGTKKKPVEDYIPPRLYLPDGREVPVCVILTRWEPAVSDEIRQMKFPGSVIGGGYPVMTMVQETERWATLGCLVTDGRFLYGLTNAHVAGRPGEKLYTTVNGNEREMGVSAHLQAGKVPFSQIYENLPGKHTVINMDVGLIEFSDIHQVTSQVFGLDRVNGLADINHDTLSLNLIGCPVKAVGCASGLMKGEIIAMFYRYASSGGYDCVSDYLVGPRRDELTGKIHPFAPANGDSGTLIVTDLPDTTEDLKAIGVLWGGQHDNSGGNRMPYALVTNLGTVCRQLDVELIGNWNTGYDRYFGAYAHVVLPSLCPTVVKDAKLRALMKKNVDSIGMDIQATEVKATKGLSKETFVPLSDVPDLVWKKRGGKFLRGKEGPNHFADLDQPNPHQNNKTLLQICKDTENIDPAVWLRFYKEIKAGEKGALPFRIGQIYGEMTGFAETGDTAKFIAAAGILTHYVFDASLMMHISYLHHGDPDGEMNSKGKPVAYDVHDEFDNQLVERYSKVLRDKLPALVKKAAKANQPVKLMAIRTKRDAAVAAFTLMNHAVELARPADVVRDFADLLDLPKKERSAEMWKKYGNKLMQSIAEGVVLAARLWEAAWIEGKGEKKIRLNGAVPKETLRKLYERKTGFLDSLNLEELARVFQ